jgi:YD repeat-containing protein
VPDGFVFDAIPGDPVKAAGISMSSKVSLKLRGGVDRSLRGPINRIVKSQRKDRIVIFDLFVIFVNTIGFTGIRFESPIYLKYFPGEVAPIALTEIRDASRQIVTVDFDAQDRLVGVELVGVKEFTLECIRRRLPFKIPKRSMDKTR